MSVFYETILNEARDSYVSLRNKIHITFYIQYNNNNTQYCTRTARYSAWLKLQG